MTTETNSSAMMTKRLRVGCCAVTVMFCGEMSVLLLWIAASPNSSAPRVSSQQCYSAVLLGINAAHETGHVHVGPVGILRFELCAQLLSRVVSRNALAFQCQGARPEVVDKGALLRDQRPITGRAVVGENVLHVESRYLVENSDPTRRRPSIAEDVRN